MKEYEPGKTRRVATTTPSIVQIIEAAAASDKEEDRDKAQARVTRAHWGLDYESNNPKVLEPKQDIIFDDWQITPNPLREVLSNRTDELKNLRTILDIN